MVRITSKSLPIAPTRRDSKCFTLAPGPRDELVACIEKWFGDENYKEKVTEEYLNERSHFRETGIKTKRYERGTHIPRNFEVDGPALDENGKYRPRKPQGWDESYPNGPPGWTKHDYTK